MQADNKTMPAAVGAAATYPQGLAAGGTQLAAEALAANLCQSQEVEHARIEAAMDAEGITDPVVRGLCKNAPEVKECQNLLQVNRITGISLQDLIRFGLKFAERHDEQEQRARAEDGSAIVTACAPSGPTAFTVNLSACAPAQAAAPIECSVNRDAQRMTGGDSRTYPQACDEIHELRRSLAAEKARREDLETTLATTLDSMKNVPNDFEERTRLRSRRWQRRTNDERRNSTKCQ